LPRQNLAEMKDFLLYQGVPLARFPAQSDSG
jgi:hypothetical protein